MIETTVSVPTTLPGDAVPVLTSRGQAALRLSEFSDVWDELSPADRRWFAEWLRELLVDAVLPETA